MSAEPVPGFRRLISANAEKAAGVTWRRTWYSRRNLFERTLRLSEVSVIRHATILRDGTSIDDELNRERRQTIFRLFVAACLLLALGYVGYTRVAGQYSEVVGVVMSVDRSQSISGGRPYFLVKLSDSTVVRARVETKTPVRLGAKARISRSADNGPVTVKYQFLGYENDAPPS